MDYAHIITEMSDYLSYRDLDGIEVMVESLTAGNKAFYYMALSHKDWELPNSRIAQFRYIKIQPKTIDLSTRLVGITTEFVGFIPTSLVLRPIVLG